MEATSELGRDGTTSSQLPGEDDLIEGLPEPPDEAPPPTIAPPGGYDALCDMGLEMWPLVRSFGEPDQDVAEVAERYERWDEALSDYCGLVL